MTDHHARGRADLRQLAWLRCRGICEGCEGRLGARWELHHRQLLGQGGPDCLCNVLALHCECHNMAADQWSVHQQPAMARANGLMVSAWGNPAHAPLLLGGLRRQLGVGTWVLLQCDALQYLPGAALLAPEDQPGP